MNEAEKLRVLIVEDDADACANLAEIVRWEEGCEVETAASAGEVMWGWGDAPRRRHDLILLDWFLPDISGEEMLSVLRSRAPEAAVVVITGHSDVGTAITALRRGASDYLLKPIDPAALRASFLRLRERRWIEGAMREAQARAMQAERLAAIGQMMAGLSHESRNALQRSQACLEMLAIQVAGQPAALGLIERLQSAQCDLHRLYESVREYAAPIVLDRRPCCLRTIWRDAWSQLRDAGGAEFGAMREVIRDDPLACEVDSFRLGQVFRNLFENAVAASDSPAWVGVSARRVASSERPAIEVCVSDVGRGLAPEHRSRVFEPFFTTKTRGTGLGLAIAKRIIEAHGGTIVVGDNWTEGAEFVIRIPREAA